MNNRFENSVESISKWTAEWNNCKCLFATNPDSSDDLASRILCKRLSDTMIIVFAIIASNIVLEMKPIQQEKRNNGIQRIKQKEEAVNNEKQRRKYVLRWSWLYQKAKKKKRRRWWRILNLKRKTISVLFEFPFALLSIAIFSTLGS